MIPSESIGAALVIEKTDLDFVGARFELSAQRCGQAFQIGRPDAELLGLAIGQTFHLHSGRKCRRYCAWLSR